ncbi:MAG: glycosyltransferase [Desulfobacteraceae bacterium]|nr:MAG: glycosyltransferase [Desulfobacteraceae bacterium]
MIAKKPTRIIRIIARLNVGGPAIQAVSLSSELPKDLYQTMLVCGKVSPWEGDMGYFAKEKGIKPLIIPRLGRKISPIDDMKSFFALRDAIKRFRPHIIHTHTAKAGTLGRLAAVSINSTFRSGKRIRLVHTFHGHTFHSYFSPLKTFLFIQIERFLAKFTDRIIVISPLQRNDISYRYRIANNERVRILPLGFDLSTFSNCDKHPGNLRERYLSSKSPETVLVGIIGRLAEVKNHCMLMDAAKHLQDRGELDPFRFVVVGDGELRAKLMKYAEALGVQDAVMFTGWQRNMAPVYKALDILALTSKNEGTPVTLIEAMAAKKPVVATDVGGVRDLMGDIREVMPNGFLLAENGILVPSEDGDALANTLLFLLKNREMSTQMVKRAHTFVHRQYSMERLLTDIKLLYNELMNGA